MFGIGMQELVVILIIVVIIFGGKRLPEIGAGMGKAIKGFKSAISEPEKPEKPNPDKIEGDKTA